MKKTIATSDIVLAAYLRVKGHQLAAIEKSGNKGTFTFNDIEHDDIQAFNLSQGLVEPVAFNDAIKALTTSVRRII